MVIHAKRSMCRYKYMTVIIITSVIIMIMNFVFHDIFSQFKESDDILHQSVIFDNIDNASIKRKQYDLRVIVITYNRYQSLLRLLKSLNDAEYYSDDIKIEVWIDRSSDGDINRYTLESANMFLFEHGDYEVILHQHHVGILGQWLATWKPDYNSSEIAVILEDDITVSKYFWIYLKLVHRLYDGESDINGYSLQGYSKTFSIKDEHVLQGPNSSNVFLFPVLGTWGFSPSVNNWLTFLDWYTSEETRNIKPYVPGNIASQWYRSFIRQGKQHTMWEIWHIYYAWKNNEYTLYCNFPGHTGLTSNWREQGLHFHRTEGQSNSLLTIWQKGFERLPKQPIYLDLSGNVISV